MMSQLSDQPEQLSEDYEQLIHRLEHSDGRIEELLKDAACAIRNLYHANQVLWNSVHNSEAV